MKICIWFVFVALFALSAFGQTLPANMAAAGVSYGDSVAGTAMYARQVSATTYSFSVIDAVPASYHPFSVTTNVTTGVAQQVLAIKSVRFYIPLAAGFSWAGANKGWAWETGGLLAIPKGQFRIMPNVRLVKSSVNNNSGYQVIGGVMFGWGW